MHRLSHTARTPRPAPHSVAGLLRRATRRLQRARLHYGHGTDNARDEAAALIWHALRLPRHPSAARLRRAITPRQRTALDALLKRRISERLPAVYLTHRCWFAGLEFYVDERVLIPRAPGGRRGDGLRLHRDRLRQGLSARARRCPGTLAWRPRGGAEKYPAPSPRAARPRPAVGSFRRPGRRVIRYYRQQSTLCRTARNGRVAARIPP